MQSFDTDSLTCMPFAVAESLEHYVHWLLTLGHLNALQAVMHIALHEDASAVHNFRGAYDAAAREIVFAINDMPTAALPLAELLAHIRTHCNVGEMEVQDARVSSLAD